MLSGRNRVQLVAFVLIAAVSVVYAGANYAGLDRLFGTRGYVVIVQLRDSGGIFTGAQVTYRGVAVGEVAELRLADSGVEAVLDIESDAPPIPADTKAAVANRSAVGEQYVDLLPTDDDGPYLQDGSVITSDRTSIPLSPETVLSNLNDLVASVDTRSLRTVVDEAYDAFADVGPDLGTLLDTANDFTITATEHLPQTRALLSDGRTVLETQRRQADDIATLASGLREVTARLKQADPDLRTVIDDAPALGAEVRELLAASGTDLGAVIANLLTTSAVLNVRTDAVEQALVALPVISAFTRSTSSNGEGHLGFVLNFFNPPGCTKGYEGTNQRPASDTSEAPPNTEAYCAEPPGSPTGVRGAQNAPRPDETIDLPGAPRTADPGQPEQSGESGRPGGSDRPGRQSADAGGDPAGGDSAPALPGLLGFTAPRDDKAGTTGAGEATASGIGALLGLDR